MTTDPAPPRLPASPRPVKRHGLSRLWHAGQHSLAGLRAGWHEPAFRQEVLAATLLLPLALWLGQDWVERTLLLGVVSLVMVVELLNTAIETAIDRISPEWHPLSKRAKDLGSAAVLISLLLALFTWASAFWNRFSP